MVTERNKFKNMLENTSYFQIRRKSIVQYDQSEFTRQKQEQVLELLAENGKDTYRGEMSVIAQKNLRKKIQIWHSGIEKHNASLYCSNGKGSRMLVFVTLTLSAQQRHSDQQIKSGILKPFMRVLREKYGCSNYVWKAESQENGNIHFHVIIDKFVDKKEIQTIWNKCQQSLFYIDRFEDKHRHRNPPSTHIEVIPDIERIENYIEKYICKDDNYRKIEGAIWKASKSVNTLKFCEMVEDGQLKEAINQSIEKNECKMIEKERYRMFFFENTNVFNILPTFHRMQYLNYLQSLNDYLFVDDEGLDFSDYCIKRKNEIDKTREETLYENVFSRRKVGMAQLVLFELPEDKELNKKKRLKKRRDM